MTATGLRRNGDRVVGVETSDGLVEADAVVVAAGVVVAAAAWRRRHHRRRRHRAAAGAQPPFPIAERIEPVVYGPLAAKQYTLFRDLAGWDAEAFTEEWESQDAVEMLELVAQRADG